MNSITGGATATEGHVYGAGMGVETAHIESGSNRSKRMVTYDERIYTIGGLGKTWDYYEADRNFAWEYFVNDLDPAADDYKSGKTKYLTYLQTLALVSDADVTIDGSASVKGNVYGGSQSGFVQRDTELKILGAIGTDGSIIDGNVYGGGKGLATSLGILLLLNWQIGLICLIFAISLMAVTRMVSLGSIAAAVLFPVLTIFIHEHYLAPGNYIVFGIVMAGLVIFNHRENLKRIFNGSENRINLKKDKEEKEG